MSQRNSSAGGDRARALVSKRAWVRLLRRLAKDCRGLTVVELLLSLALAGTIAAILIPSFASHAREVRLRAGMMSLRTISTDISIYKDIHGTLPESLDDLPRVVANDGWGRQFVYVKLEGKPNSTGLSRKDHWLNPVNTDYDLYSLGADGDTHPQLSVGAGRDDVIRGQNGAYYGLAEGYGTFVGGGPGTGNGNGNGNGNGGKGGKP